MKKLTILSSMIAFLLLSSVATYARTMSQSTQNNSNDTEQVTESTDKAESEQQNSTDTEETDSSTNKPESTNDSGY